MQYFLCFDVYYRVKYEEIEMELMDLIMQTMRKNNPVNDMYQVNKEPPQIRMAKQIERNKQLIKARDNEMFQQQNAGRVDLGNYIIKSMIDRYFEELTKEPKLANNPRQIR